MTGEDVELCNIGGQWETMMGKRRQAAVLLDERGSRYANFKVVVVWLPMHIPASDGFP